MNCSSFNDLRTFYNVKYEWQYGLHTHGWVITHRIKRLVYIHYMFYY